MTDNKHQSSFASTTAAQRPEEVHQAPASRVVEGHEKPLPSIELDMIDKLS
jgi:hypothetical protein